MTADEKRWLAEATRLIAGKQILDITYEPGSTSSENVLTIWLADDILIQLLRDCEVNGVGALAIVIEDEDGTHTIPGTLRM